MRDQVNYYLDRARAAALAGTLGTLTEVEPVIAGLARTFAKIYRDKDLAVELAIAAGSALPRRAAGPRGDGRQPHRQRRQMGRPQGGGRSRDRARGRPVAFLLLIDDDGPGLPEAAREEVLKRGRRLDETKPGSGLGLSIVSDLAALYRGSLRLDASPMGGLRAILELPGQGRAQRSRRGGQRKWIRFLAWPAGRPRTMRQPEEHRTSMLWTFRVTPCRRRASRRDAILRHFMVIWIILMAMTAAAVMAVLWPLSRHRARVGTGDPDTQFYRDQIAEIERDRERGLLMPSEAEAAKAEAGTTPPAGDGRPRHPIRRRRRAGPAPPPRRFDPGPVDRPDPRARPLRRSTARRNLPSSRSAPAAAGATASTSSRPSRRSRRIWPRIRRTGAAGRSSLRSMSAWAAWTMRVQGLRGRPAPSSAATRHGSRQLRRSARARQGRRRLRGGSGGLRAGAEAGCRLAKARFYLARAAEQDGQIDKAKAAIPRSCRHLPPTPPGSGGAEQTRPPRRAARRRAATRMPRPSPAWSRASRPGWKLGRGRAEDWARLIRSYAVLGDQRDKATAPRRRRGAAWRRTTAGLETIDAMARELKLTDAHDSGR